MQSGLIIENDKKRGDFIQLILNSSYPRIKIDIIQDLGALKPILFSEKYDIALINIETNDNTGIEILRTLYRLAPNTERVIITDTPQDVTESFECGANGYLLLDDPLDSLVSALQGIKLHKPAVSPQITRQLIHHFHSSPNTNKDKLTARERDVLQLLCKGLNRPQIAELLKLSPHTIADHTKNIYRKIDVSSRTEAVHYAVTNGLLDR